ncbi:MAG: ParB/RepB/Spo0J family partition protein [Candidatus Moraniibacteriota bacterium]|nr:MAG: ParB/RepB/Spo0J family partition protein [Candidatus Moranbacteria bacterium]
MAQSHGLGKGLSSLIPRKPGPFSEPPSSEKAVRVPVFSAVSLETEAPASPTPQETHPLKKIVQEEKEQVLPMPGGSSLGGSEPSSSNQAVESLSTTTDELGSGHALMVPTEKVAPNPHQPRTQFSEEKLFELAQSIREHGILQPLIVTRRGDAFELIAGERRLEAAKMVGLAEVPVLVREAEEEQKFELAIIENIQRHDLNPIEESRAYDRLSKEFHLSQEEIAKKMGRSRSAIANTMRLLQLPIDIQRAVSIGKISEGHAKALLSIENSEKQRALFELIVGQGLTVREAEIKSRAISTRRPRTLHSFDPDTKAREASLSERFGTKVHIAKTATGGSIRIDYFSDEEFKAIFSKLSGNEASEQ